MGERPLSGRGAIERQAGGHARVHAGRIPAAWPGAVAGAVDPDGGTMRPSHPRREFAIAAGAGAP